MKTKIIISLSWPPELHAELQKVADYLTDGNLSMLVGMFCKEYLEGWI